MTQTKSETGNFGRWLEQQAPAPEPEPELEEPDAETMKAELWAVYHALDIEDRNDFYAIWKGHMADA